jgi:FlaA1/EpsC-like NDP-sugar epimerase
MSPKFRHLALLRAAKLFDLGIVGLAFLAAMAIGLGSFTWLRFTEVLAMRIQLFNLIFIAVYIGLCAAIFSACGFYLSHRLSHWHRQLREVLTAVTIITAILWLANLLVGFYFASNLFLIVFWVLTVAGLLLTRLVGQRLLYFVRSRGRNLRSIVVVGEGADAAALAERIESESALGYRVVRVIDATKG